MKVGQYEYSLADMFEFYGREHDRAGLAFSTIVAAGKNAVILHYPQQNDRISENEAVLFDLGFEHNLYCADISRTFPISGEFTEKQRRIYSAVLACNKALIEYAKPGLTLKDLQSLSCA
jgi:Xaa-Pro aminopeptidase